MKKATTSSQGLARCGVGVEQSGMIFICFFFILFFYSLHAFTQSIRLDGIWLEGVFGIGTWCKPTHVFFLVDVLSYRLMHIYRPALDVKYLLRGKEVFQMRIKRSYESPFLFVLCSLFLPLVNSFIGTVLGVYQERVKVQTQTNFTR